MLHTSFLANAINSWVSPINHFEENTKEVNQIYLATWAEDINEFDSLQYATLYTIATENAAIGGNATYAARVMLGLDVDDNTPNSSARLIFEDDAEVTNSSKFIVKPNPAKDKITISFDLPINENVTLTIYDNQGILVEVIRIKSVGFYRENQIEVKNLSSGLHAYLIVAG